MRRPDDVPEDVWDTANHSWFGSEEGDETPAVEVLARAILAERERCANVAYEGRIMNLLHTPGGRAVIGLAILIIFAIGYYAYSAYCSWMAGMGAG